MDVRSLRRPLPVGSWINTLVHHAALQGGMGRDHLLIKPEHGIISGQAPSMELSLALCRVSRARSEEKEDPAPSKDLLCLWFFFFVPSVIPTSS